MTDNEKKALWIGIVLVAVLCLLFFTVRGRLFTESYRTDVLKARDSANYETQKKVEDTARAMIASYKSDVQMYHTYLAAGETSLAIQAKLRANKTAAEYNEYVLKNRFIWETNVPNDIDQELVYLED